MTRTVQCVKLGRELPGLDKPPFPGPLGERIYNEVSQQAWDMWQEQSRLIINHYGLNLADPDSRQILRQANGRILFAEMRKCQRDGFLRDRTPRVAQPQPKVAEHPHRRNEAARRHSPRSSYELGHQPLALAMPLAVLLEAGYQPVAIDTSVEQLTDVAITRARLVALSVPMHTAMRLGFRVAQRIRTHNPSAHICFTVCMPRSTPNICLARSRTL